MSAAWLKGNEMMNKAEPGVISVPGYRCRCGHEWVNRPLNSSERPRVCPKCKSANWDRPYQSKRS